MQVQDEQKRGKQIEEQRELH